MFASPPTERAPSYSIHPGSGLSTGAGTLRRGEEKVSAAGSPPVDYAARMFFVAWFFFGIAALFGVLLRMQFVFPLPWIDYGHFLHTHSHVAFLGWIYNAFFGLAVRFFAPEEAAVGYWRLFLATQVAVIGILITFPLQGYGLASLIFSTLHMACAAVFVCRLLRRNRGGSVSRAYLWAASLFMLLSLAGPLSMAPIMIFGYGDTPLYGLSIAYYLHFQYNGWFVFFLMAVVFQALHEGTTWRGEGAARKALIWLTAGCVLTFALSALPLNPPRWVFFVVAAGGVAQLIGAGYCVRAVREVASLFSASRAALLLAVTAGVCFLLKIVLQGLAAWPALLELATSRYTIIAFMHLVFLGVATSLLIAWEVTLKWMPLTGFAMAGLVMLAAGAFVSQLALGYMPIATAFGGPVWLRFFETQFLSALLILMGVVLLGAAMGRTRRGGITSPAAGGQAVRR
jgi:hypothetical protein